ncbi:Midasin [Exophiala dermatitidis]
MDDIAVYCSWADSYLNEEPSLVERVPAELRSVLSQSTGSQYLESLARATRSTQHADTLFPLYKGVYPELVSRWIDSSSSDFNEAILAVSCLARILPFAGYLRHYVPLLLQSEPMQSHVMVVEGRSSELTEERLHMLLLALFRLLSFDSEILAESSSPMFFSSFLHHHSLPLRYLAIQCLCVVMHLADALSEQLIQSYVGKGPIWGQWEGRRIDYRLLKLWEERRWRDVSGEVKNVEEHWRVASASPWKRNFSTDSLSPRTADVGGVLLARNAALEDSSASRFVLTPTATRNLNRLASCLLDRRPVLVCGSAGSSKTSLVHEAGRLLNKLSSMVTLHINEQTDAKSLLGVYTSSSNGNSFTWKPGVLTKAIQQGRWVLIEDIDRAPAEVMGVLRPILENGELFLPNRKEKIHPRDGFRILATLKTASRSPVPASSRHSWLLSPRLWSTINIMDYEMSEIESLLRVRYPGAVVFIPTILRVHSHLCDLYRDEHSLKALQTRTPSLRDLLKWSRRVDKRLRDHSSTSPSAGLPESVNLHIFSDAVDCYAGHLNDDSTHDLVAACIAREMGISPQQMRHCLDEAWTTITETSSEIIIGRSMLKRVSHHRRPASKAPFALTRHAQRTLSRISAGASRAEPCLLVGETGVGKTTLIQYVAGLVGQTLTVVNLSQQSESSDLLGSLKPVTTRSLMLPLLEKFNVLFDDTFSTKRNEKFQVAVSKSIARQNWQRLIILWSEAVQMAEATLSATSGASMTPGSVHATKRRKLASPKSEALRERWSDFAESLNRIRAQVDHGNKNQTFAFVEGRLVQAVRDGEWVLLDEINLASPDTLDHIVSLLNNGDDDKPTLLLTEAGNIESIVAHPNFRIFAAMNPATDAGKKDLAPGLRSRFTEIYVPSGDSDVDDLTKIIRVHLGTKLDNDKRAALDLANAYLDLKKLNHENKLTDGAGDIPHFSIRSLVRCLLYVSQHSASHGLRRAMYEGFAMSFFTVLSRASENLALPILEKHLLSNVKNKKSFLGQQPKLPYDTDDYVSFRHHLVKKGPMSPDLQPHYIRTPSVERNLLNLARAASMRRFPILLQGPTSAGKTSMVEYLAKLSGNKFVRINNHEHTDLQEYLGSYDSGADGKLVYREGVLVDALRQGHWIVLDELNLAPSDVLEALNRLLDDNRELLIPESQEIVRPHPNFMLFATQNPAGLYGGRKRLSRAFRNRFLELHFDDIPEDELEIILRERAQLAPSFCSQIVAVYKRLSLQRQSTRLFEQRNSFATLRDLFRWAARPMNDRQQLANHGFMLLGERVRDPAERAVVKRTIEETMKVFIDENSLYGPSAIPQPLQSPGTIVWTSAMRRLFVLVSEALKNNEPVLLVGETGCGKTQICQVVSEAFGRPLRIYNAHTNTETSDLIGSQRPVRNRSELENKVRENWGSLLSAGTSNSLNEDLSMEQLTAEFARMDTSNLDPDIVQRTKSSIAAYQSLFTWSDGSLVRAMKAGEHFLLDEISLADDSVLERLNSVLEPSRTILLAEKGSVDNLVTAQPTFQFLATMNPGGDYGKRELSAALRNRLTEIWVPPLSNEADIIPIVQNKLSVQRKHLAPAMLDFAMWFRRNFHNTASTAVPLRDLLAWAGFINHTAFLEESIAFTQGAFMVYVDSIGANPAGMTATGSADLYEARRRCLEHLQTLVKIDVYSNYHETPELNIITQGLHVGPYLLPCAEIQSRQEPDLVFGAPTTLQNTMRIVRALQMPRPILLEGSPGVGKTAIVTALARASGKQFTRINLSDQTDLMDLFGADTPAENEKLGNFSWQNGPLLDAMQNGGWVLLDEMNLASQSVLEGLNSCLDHRREVYIAELDKSFTCHPEFTLFAAQNPHHQGGGRKGLPASFVNRFTVVYADSFRKEDLMLICQHKYPNIPVDQLGLVINSIYELERAISRVPAFGLGGPWEFNLRDVDRWLTLCEGQPTLSPLYHFRTIAMQRFRTAAQKEHLLALLPANFSAPPPESFYSDLATTALQLGTSTLARNEILQQTKAHNLALPVAHLPAANSIITAINKRWPVILAGPSGSGKTSVIRLLAAISGAELVEFSMNADVDTLDLVGGFEQYDARRDIVVCQRKAKEAVRYDLVNALRDSRPTTVKAQLLELWDRLQSEDMDASALQRILSSACEILPELTDVVASLSDLLDFADASYSRFVWNDGILVDAVERGSWLVLDNANLCNPSVLDRLNSLLEPNGALAVSEQHNTGSNSRVIIPHKDFRIFLTLDPQYGELSRAMRNRSLEVYMGNVPEEQVDTPAIQYPCTSSVARLRYMHEASCEVYSEEAVVESFVDNLSMEEMALAVESVDDLPVGAASPILSMELSKRSALDEKFLRQFVPVDVLASTRLPQLITLNEPWILLDGLRGIDFLRHVPIDVLTRGWYVCRRAEDIRAKLRDASSTRLAIPFKEQTVLQKSTALTYDKKRLDTVPQIATFANSLLTELSASVKSGPSASLDAQSVEAIECMLLFAQDLVDRSNTESLDTALMHAYLQIGFSLARSLQVKFQELARIFSTCLQILSLHAGGLRTGLSLQLMWQPFQPKTAKSMSQLGTQLALEELILRFDKLCRYLPDSRATLSALRSKLQATYTSIVESDHPDTSITALQGAVATLEEQSQRGFFLQGKLEKALNYIYQVLKLQSGQIDSRTLSILEMFVPESKRKLLTIGDDMSVTASLSEIASLDASVVTDHGHVGLDLIRGLCEVQDQPLGALNHAKEELSTLIKATTSVPDSFDRVTEVLVGNIHTLLSGLVSVHRDFLSEEARVCLVAFDSVDLASLASLSQTNPVVLDGQDRAYFRDVFHLYLLPVVQILAGRRPVSIDDIKTCLTKLSLAGLILMVPDKAFDPAMLPHIAYGQQQRRINELHRRINGQKVFHRLVLGQETSLVIRILEQEAHDLGSAASPPTVIRPSRTELPKLQEVFTRIANVVAPVHSVDSPQPGTSEWMAQWSSAHGKKNLAVIIERLEHSNRAYDDFVKPIEWFLKILSLALELQSATAVSSPSEGPIQVVVRHTPLLGASPEDLLAWDAPLVAQRKLQLLWLKYAGVATNLFAKQGFSESHGLLSLLNQFYTDWKAYLSSGQAESAIRSRYYTYRGGGEKEEENELHEMNDMFPQFDHLETKTTDDSQSYDARTIAVQLAGAHEQIYGVDDPSKALENYILGAMRVIPEIQAGEREDAAAGFTDLLPGILLQMKSELTGLNTRRSDARFNIYTDCDVIETQKLMDLVRQVEARFQEISERWPEHAVPAEVLSFCREIWHLSMKDPVAKLLTKTEKLYEIVSQWQSVASREWSVSSLIEQLSSLVISWRRLELLSWSRLLDDEQIRHEADAKAWYFVAYEAVVYNATRLASDNEELQAYCTSLAQTLEEFLKTTTLGQYSSRLRLLSTLKTLLNNITRHEKQLLPVRNCVANVTQHYRRYESNVSASLRNGRADLEKSLNEQIKLASWKDTNVTALRDSARRSHHKLFKIVRKYRDFLNQIVTVFKTAEDANSAQGIEETLGTVSEPFVNKTAVSSAQKQCRELVADWESRPERLVNPLGAVESMRRLYSSNCAKLQPHLELASFREDLLNAIKELRTQTPSALTDENAAFVRHLQERKRRLLTETLKAVSKMGIRRNLPTSELEKQSSVASVLSLSPDILVGNASQGVSAADNAFHDLLDAMSEVRAARVAHCDDLTEGEINRSVGLLEGLLYLTIRQRQDIVSSSQELRELNDQVSTLRSFQTWSPDKLSVTTTSAGSEQLRFRLAWLSEILTLAVRLLDFQAQSAGFEVKELIESINSYSGQVREIRSKLDDLPLMPVGLQTKDEHSLVEQTSETLSKLGLTLREWKIKEPRIEFILRQIIPWVEHLPTAQSKTINGVVDMGVESFDDDLRNLLDQVFVALQRLSSSQHDLPQTVQDQSWLSKLDGHFARAVRSLQPRTISTGLAELLAKVHSCNPSSLVTISNLVRVALPIIEQYYHILEHLHRQQAALHLETSQLALQLARSFTTLASQGFCRPSEPSEGEEKSGKLESGTGLGEGEGAEDISKDVGDDEDLSELAQSGQKEEPDNEIEDAEDAIDMGHDDLAGDTGDQGEQESGQDKDGDGSDEEGDDEIDEETGSVDDLDPSAVDEKMWDDMKNESEKDKELKNDKAEGKKSDDQTTADGQQPEGEDMDGLEGDEVEEEGPDETDGGERPEAENMDPHLDNEKPLELPEELQLNGEDEMKEDDISDDGMDELSDIDEAAKEEVDGVEKDDGTMSEESRDEADIPEEVASDQEELDGGTAQDDEIVEDQLSDKEDEEQSKHDTRQDDEAHDMDEPTGGETGAANEIQDSVDPDQNLQGMNASDKEPDPRLSRPGKAPENQEQGETGTGAVEQGSGRADTLERQQNEALRKLADVLDRYHQKREILPASDEHQEADGDNDVDMADVDFEHVQDEAEGDAQALGAAAGDEAQNLDQSRAIEDEDVPINEDTELPDVPETEASDNMAERLHRLQAQPKTQESTGAGGFIPGQETRRNEQDNPATEADAASDDLAPEIEHLDLQPNEPTETSPPTSTSDAVQLWNHCSAVTHQFSLVLTEQLRLILSPTTATKLRGDYRTGKRLNIKRIIPYIASSYKRDKIWMRRSVPSKRNYQIMIAVDDSKSMSESGADLLAFETLAMLTKSLSMLEVGELCVVGFGDQENITVAHPFGTPFSPAESGPNVFRAFSFAQRGTNVRNLVRQSIQLFRDARLKGHSASEDLWQLQLVVSDGHCSDHEAIARLVRQAQAEKIVIVFVIVDAGPESILDLKEAVFEPDPNSAGGADSGPVEMRVRTKRYLEDFPFPYYLVVRDVRDLPGVLATALKGWFGSVIDVQG